MIFEVTGLKGGVADTDPDQLDLPLERGVVFDLAVDLIYRRSLLLAERSVHVEDFDDDDGGLDVADFKIRRAGQPEVLLILRGFRRRQREIRKRAAHRRRLVAGPGGSGCQQNN